MLKIRALNRESSSDEDAPSIRKEAQEEITLDLYNKALKLLHDGQLDESEKTLRKLIDENIPQLENQGGLPKTMSTIKYSCYINVARILLEKNDSSDALEHYLYASELDSTDVTLWYKIGKLALKLDRFRQAAHAFSKGLENSEAHWPCLDQLITLLYGIQDTIGCLYYIDRALNLDPYYIKGLVLRERIYESNPGTRDYYKCFKHEYMIEVDPNISVEEKDKEECLREVQALCDQINEAERKLEPPPLPTIPLPTPLADYTWVALGQTLIDLHKYISENNMSHFTKVDLTKCMSQHMETDTIEPTTEEKMVTEEKETIEPKPPEACPIKEPTDSDSLNIRRMSQNSEHTENEGGENVTPTQTDDNEEMEQDLEDGDDNADQKTDKNRSLNKGTKRKRDLLSDLQIWGWHSKRKSAKRGKQEKDLTVEDALTRIVPSHLLTCNLEAQKTAILDDSMSTMDLYNIYMTEKKEESSALSPDHNYSLQTSEDYFGSVREREDVLKFWNKKWESCDAVYMIEEYMFTVSKLWHYKWPQRLQKIYIDLYSMFREHCDQPPPFGPDEDLELLKNDYFATLLYGELLQFSLNKSDTVIPLTSLSLLQLVSGWYEQWEPEFSSFFLRVHWLRSHFYRKEGNNEMAIQALQLVQEEIVKQPNDGEKFSLTLPNCAKCNLVSLEVIETILQHLELIKSLSQLEQLFESKDYVKVASILKTTFGTNTSHPACGKICRPAQLGMLLHSLWYTDLTECFVWSEECLNESLNHFLKPAHLADKWEMIIEKCLLIMLDIIKKETVTVVDALSEDKRRRLVETLAKIVCYQVNKENTNSIPLGTLKPWILLHYVLQREEHRMQARIKTKHVGKRRRAEEGNQHVPPSIAVLFSAHQFLGPKGWCIIGQGELLHFILDVILDRLDTPIFEKLRDKIDIHIEQAFFCLYQHPRKKNKMSRHLADHNVNPLPLSWERAHQLYEFYCPERLPEFDSYRSVSISSELEQLLQRITAFVPPECDPQPTLPKIKDFIEGKLDVLPQPVDFPFKVKAIYYLLADHYFKQQEVTRSLKYYLLDLCVNPLRIDSWACVALGFGSVLEGKLTHCEKFQTDEFLDKAKSAHICFQQALKLANDHITLWTEFGSFEYMVHSFCSRVLKYESDMMSMEKFEFLENAKDSYLTCAEESFQRSLSLFQPDQSEVDERWLFHYMLAKVAEKRKREPLEYLQHYLSASALLEENNATYPDKISYNSPQHLALEALEVHYRIHASILKYLELHEGKPIPCSIGKLFKKCLNASVLPKKNYKKTETADPKPEKTEVAPSQDILPEVKECLEDILSKLEKTAEEQPLSSFDDQKKEPEVKKEEPGVFEKPKSAQEIMDALMQEAMSKQQDEAADTDSDASVMTVIPKIEEQKDCVKSETKTDEIKEEQNIRKSTDTSSSTSSSSSSSSGSESDSDDSSSSTSSTSSDSNGNLSEAEVLNLVERCISGLEQCIIRLPLNYKAVYRLAHVYFNYKPKKDLNKCKQLFLNEYTCKNSVIINGLFSDRKPSNFFNGVWRIPSSEIDRPGSLAAHMGRCVSLLLQMLCSSNDHRVLLDISIQLKRTPDPDKVYIRDADRKQLSEQAVSLCIQILKMQIKKADGSTTVAEQKHQQRVLLDIFKAYQKVQKHMAQKESAFAGLLVDMYRKVVGQVPENMNVLELAVKYCQQHKPTEKPKVLNYNPTPRSSLFTTNTPVLPTPSNVTGQTTVPLKRPTLGRPRGRPPGPKLAGQQRTPRGRSPNVSSATYWQNEMLKSKTAMEYLKHYQEALLQQYSKSLSYNPNVGFGNPFANTAASSSAFLQFLQGRNQFGLPNVPVDKSAQKATTSATPKSNPLGQGGFSAGSSKLPAYTPKKTYSNPALPAEASTSGLKYSNADFAKQFNKSSTTTTSSYQQQFLEATRLAMEARQTIKKKERTKGPKLPNRPNISITPVNPTPVITTNVPKFVTPPTSVPSSPGKTLQEKLAEKQKQLSNKHAQDSRKSENTYSPTSSLGSIVLPSSLTISRTSNVPSFPVESGVSINQIPLNKPSSSAEIIHSPRKEQVIKRTPPPSHHSPQSFKPTNAPVQPSVTLDPQLPPNIPISLSVIKKPDEMPARKASSDDDVIIIE